MRRSLHVAVQSRSDVVCNKAIFRIKILGHGIEKVVAIVDGLSHTAVVGNDILDL